MKAHFKLFFVLGVVGLMSLGACKNEGQKADAGEKQEQVDASKQEMKKEMTDKAADASQAVQQDAQQAAQDTMKKDTAAGQ